LRASKGTAGRAVTGPDAGEFGAQGGLLGGPAGAIGEGGPREGFRGEGGKFVDKARDQFGADARDRRAVIGGLRLDGIEPARIAPRFQQLAALSQGGFEGIDPPRMVGRDGRAPALSVKIPSIEGVSHDSASHSARLAALAGAPLTRTNRRPGWPASV
jgi:hypothetical protein